MPVYKQTYRHYSGVYHPRALAWIIIAMRGMKQVWFGKGFKFLLLLSLAPFIVNLVRIYLVSNMELLRYLDFNPNHFKQILDINDEFYLNYIRIQHFFLFLMTLIVGADIIAADRRCKALVLYLSRPLGRVDYLFGKGFVVLFYLYCISLIPALLLMFFYAFFNDNWQYLLTNMPLAMRIIAYSNVIVLSLVFVVLTISALVKSKVGAGVMFCAAYFLPWAMGGIFSQMFSDPLFGSFLGGQWWSLIALQSIWEQLGYAIFQQKPLSQQMHWMYHGMALAMVIGICSFILFRKIRAVEVVK